MTQKQVQVHDMIFILRILTQTCMNTPQPFSQKQQVLHGNKPLIILRNMTSGPYQCEMYSVRNYFRKKMTLSYHQEQKKEH